MAVHKLADICIRSLTWSWCCPLESRSSPILRNSARAISSHQLSNSEMGRSRGFTARLSHLWLVRPWERIPGHSELIIGVFPLFLCLFELGAVFQGRLLTTSSTVNHPLGSSAIACSSAVTSPPLPSPGLDCLEFSGTRVSLGIFDNSSSGSLSFTA